MKLIDGYDCGWTDASVWDVCLKATDWLCSGGLLVSCVDGIRPPVPGCLRVTPELYKLVPDLPLVEFCYWIPQEHVRKVVQADFIFAGFCELIVVPGKAGPTRKPPVGFTTDDARFDQAPPPELLAYLNTLDAAGAIADGVGLGLNFALRDKAIAESLCQSNA